MPFFDTALKLENVAVGASICIDMNDTQIGLFRTTDGLFAIDNFCPHRGAPMHEGFVTNGVVTCPWHQWQFQLNDGVCRNIPNVRTTTYPVEVRDGVIWINYENQESTP